MISTEEERESGWIKRTKSWYFFRPPFTFRQSICWYEKHPDASMPIEHEDEKGSKSYGCGVAWFRPFRNFALLQCHYSDHRYSSSNDHSNNKIANFSYISDVCCQIGYSSQQFIYVDFKLSEDFPSGIVGFALVLTNMLVSICSVGQRHVDLLW